MNRPASAAPDGSSSSSTTNRLDSKPKKTSISSLFSCVTPNQHYMPSDGPVRHRSRELYDAAAALAHKVASGEMTAPTGMERNTHYFPNSSFGGEDDATETVDSSVSGKISLGSGSQATPTTTSLGGFGPCPTLPNSRFVVGWNVLDTLLFCIRYHVSDYDEDGFHKDGGTLCVKSRMADSTDAVENSFDSFHAFGLPSDGKKHPFHSSEWNVELLRLTAAAPDSSTIFSAYLIQVMGLLSSLDLLDTINFETNNDKVQNKTKSETDPDDSASSTASDKNLPEKETTDLASSKAKRISEDITDLLINMALENDDLCQNLYFLFRAFINTMERARNDEKKSDFFNSTYDPVDLLRNAQRKLSDQLSDHAARKGQNGSMVAFSERIESATGDMISKGGLDLWADQTASPGSFADTESQGYTIRTFISEEGCNNTEHKANEESVSMWRDDNDENKEVVDVPSPEKERKSKNRMGKLVRMFRGSKSRSKKLDTVGTENEPTVQQEWAVAPHEDTNAGVALESTVDPPNTSLSNGISSPATRPTREPSSILRKTKVNGPDDFESVASISVVHTPPMCILFDNMTWFLTRLDTICATIERRLLKSFSQKITDWALQPWSASKDRALAEVTNGMRADLHRINAEGGVRTGDSGPVDLDVDGDENDLDRLPLLNPIDSSEIFVAVNPEECYILPSAHFPLLLCFNTNCNKQINNIFETPTLPSTNMKIFESMYRTVIEVVGLRGTSYGSGNKGGHQMGGAAKAKRECAYVVHAAVAGVVQETDRSTLGPFYGSTTHRWYSGNVLTFDTRSSWGHPKAVSLRLSSVSFSDDGHDQLSHCDSKGMLHYSSEVGHCWVDLDPLWKNVDQGRKTSGFDETGSSDSASQSNSAVSTYEVDVWTSNGKMEFDQQGFPIREPSSFPQRLSLELKITTQFSVINSILPQDQKASAREHLHRERFFLYKHGDDMRQEMLAIQFLDTCDRILRASGLDMKLETYKCIPVGFESGFIEWVSGTVPMSEICKPIGSASNGGIDITNSRSSFSASGGADPLPVGHDEALAAAQQKLDSNSMHRVSGGWCKYESLRSLRQRESPDDNPIQDFLRSAAYDPDAPYFIRKDVMDAYIKSCAGYCILTYLLGVGDRHLDNLLLHPRGHFLHCDYSFILGQDPKTYLPMRITEDMVRGMGGRESDNYAKFLSLAGAAFIALRRHNNVRTLMSLVRNVAHSHFPDVSRNQSPEEALLAMRYRFRLDLNDDEAVIFIEKLIETSIVSKVWIVVDVIHSLGKRF